MKDSRSSRSPISIGMWLLFVVLLSLAILGIVSKHYGNRTQSPPSVTAPSAQASQQQAEELERKLARLEHDLGVGKSGIGVSFKPALNAGLAEDGKPLPLVNKHGDPIILDVLPNSPALSAQIASGDAVRAVNGQPTKGWSVDRLTDTMRGPEGTRLRLTIVSDGAAHEYELTRAPFAGMR